MGSSPIFDPKGKQEKMIINYLPEDDSGSFVKQGET